MAIELLEATMGEKLPYQHTFAMLKEEHQLLQKLLKCIYTYACVLREEEDEQQLVEGLRKVKLRICALKHALQQHNEWEKQEFVPLASHYLGDDVDLIMLVDQENVLAQQYMDRYMDELEGVASPISKMKVKQLVSYLFQIYVILNNQFQDEEDLLEEMPVSANTVLA